MLNYSGQSFSRVVLAFLLVPTLWSAIFIATVIVFPDAIDPLVGGIQGVLYFFGLIWLACVLIISYSIAVLFRLRFTGFYFLRVAVVGSMIFSAAISILDIVDGLRRIGEPGVVIPNSFDDVVNFTTVVNFFEFEFFTFVVSLLTALTFIFIGGLKFRSHN